MVGRITGVSYKRQINVQRLLEGSAYSLDQSLCATFIRGRRLKEETQ